MRQACACMNHHNNTKKMIIIIFNHDILIYIATADFSFFSKFFTVFMDHGACVYTIHMYKRCQSKHNGGVEDHSKKDSVNSQLSKGIHSIYSV